MRTKLQDVGLGLTMSLPSIIPAFTEYCVQGTMLTLQSIAPGATAYFVLARQ